MIVSPELMSASSAPCASPLKSCERKLDQVSMAGHKATRQQAQSPAAAPMRCSCASGVGAEVAAERVGLLHQPRARHDLDHFPVVFLVLHVLGRLAADDDHRADELMV